MAGYSTEQRAEAVALYLEFGLADAHRLTKTEERPAGIPKSTLQRWVKQAGHDLAEIAGHTAEQTRNARNQKRLTWENRKADVILDLADLVESSIDAAQSYIDDDKPEKARACVAPIGVGIEKLLLLNGEATTIARTPWDPRAVTSEAKPRAEGLRSVPTGDAATG